MRAQPGDVIEIAVPSGFAYAQYTHEHRDAPRLGSLLRVLPGIYDRQPNLTELVEAEERFSVFVPLHAALQRGIFRIAGNAAIPAGKRTFPIFRVDVQRGAPWYWDGRKEWRRRWWQREPLWRRGAIRETWNDTALIDRIEAGWSPNV